MTENATQTSNPVSKKKPTAVVVGLDGTLCDNEHRLHLIEPPRSDWHAYHQLMAEDPVNYRILDAVVAARQAGHQVIILTGRPESYLLPTLQWLNRNYITYDELIMRDDEDERTEDQMKKDAFCRRIKPHVKPVLAFDNTPVTIFMWHDLYIDTFWCWNDNLIKMNC